MEKKSWSSYLWERNLGVVIQGKRSYEVIFPEKGIMVWVFMEKESWSSYSRKTNNFISNFMEKIFLYAIVFM